MRRRSTTRSAPVKAVCRRQLPPPNGQLVGPGCSQSYSRRGAIPRLRHPPIVRLKTPWGTDCKILSPLKDATPAQLAACVCLTKQGAEPTVRALPSRLWTRTLVDRPASRQSTRPPGIPSREQGSAEVVAPHFVDSTALASLFLSSLKVKVSAWHLAEHAVWW